MQICNLPLSQGNRALNVRPIAAALGLCAALLLNGCAPHKAAPTPKAGIFPVVVPFAVDRAGTKLALEFEVPYALYPDAPKPLLRSVFIRVRRVSKDGDLMTDAEF